MNLKLYQQCRLAHIPNRIKSRGRKVFKKFYLNEEMYRRCPITDTTPFASITLSDVSLNRQGKNKNKPLSKPEDVLFNTATNFGPNVPKFNEKVVALKIKRISKQMRFLRIFKTKNTILRMYLEHKPIPCNYAHSVFEFELNGVIVTFENYKSTLGHKQFKMLRQDCRLEIAKMIMREKII